MRVFLCLCALLLVLPGDAHAYLDPATSGVIYQALIMVVAAIAGYLAFFKRFLKSLFSKKTKDSPKDES